LFSLLLRSLALSLEVINATRLYSFNSDCIEDIMRSSYCGQCYGHKNARPCRGLCHNTIRKCLSRFDKLDVEWQRFVNSWQTLSSSIVGDRNPEIVFSQQIDALVDEAINMMQSKLQETSRRVSRVRIPGVSIPSRVKVHRIVYYCVTTKGCNGEKGVSIHNTETVCLFVCLCCEKKYWNFIECAFTMICVFTKVERICDQMPRITFLNFSLALKMAWISKFRLHFNILFYRKIIILNYIHLTIKWQNRFHHLIHSFINFCFIFLRVTLKANKSYIMLKKIEVFVDTKNNNNYHKYLKIFYILV
jgi:hypothetical protein